MSFLRKLRRKARRLLGGQTEEVIEYLLGKEEQIEIGKAVELIAALIDWPARRPGCADAAANANAKAIAEGCSYNECAYRTVRAACQFMCDH